MVLNEGWSLVRVYEKNGLKRGGGKWKRKKGKEEEEERRWCFVYPEVELRCENRNLAQLSSAAPAAAALLCAMQAKQ